jgi:hypothetical protein
MPAIQEKELETYQKRMRVRKGMSKRKRAGAGR